MFEVETLIKKHRDHIVDPIDYYEEIAAFQRKMEKKTKEHFAHGGHGSPEIPFVPLHLWKEALAILVMSAILMFFVFIFPHHEMGEKKANPLSTPAEIMPPWYFLPHFGLLRVASAENPFLSLVLRYFAILFPGIIVGLMAAYPWLDRNREIKLSRRPWAVWGSVLVWILLLLMGLKGRWPDFLIGFLGK